MSTTAESGAGGEAVPASVTRDGVSRTDLRIAYDGPALAEGRMNVRDLAPALLAIADLCDESFRLLHGQDKRLRCEVRAEFKKGSFGIHLEVIGLWNTFVELFNSEGSQAILALFGHLGLVTTGVGGLVGLVQVIRKWHGKKPTTVVKLGDGNVRLVFEGGEEVVSEQVARLLLDMKVRQILGDVVAPLDKEGIDRFQTRGEDDQPIETIEKSEASYFVAPSATDVAADAPPLIDREERRAFEVVSPTFKDDNKWRLHDGNSSLHAAVTDKAFLEKIDRREVSFTKGDVLLCDVQVRQSQGAAGGVKTEYVILRVVEHRHAPRQTLLDFPDDPTTKP